MQTAFLIDGFNFYHSIKDLDKKFHWIDYCKFCKHFLKTDDNLNKIMYFTALAHWLDGPVKRHKIFIEACLINNIQVVYGKFKKKPSKCPTCKSEIIRHEEKATDVNIALYAYRMASKGLEKIYLVTGDTDLLPAIRMIKEDFPNTQIGVIFPYNRLNAELSQEAHIYHKTTLKTLQNTLLPLKLKKQNGKIITCPNEWQ